MHIEYDDLNRLTDKRRDSDNGPLLAEYFYDAPGSLGLPEKSKAYTAQGVVEVRTPAHDARGSVLQQEWIVPGAGGGTFRMDYAYNEADQRTSLRYPGGNGGQKGELVAFGHNGVGQLQTVAGGGVSYLSQASYNALGQPIELRLDQGGNGLTRKYDYNPGTLRLDVLKVGKNAPFEDIQKLSYSYDNMGNVQSISDTRNSNQTQSFGYDWLDRLVSASTSGSGTGQYSHTYSYDSIGNPSASSGQASPVMPATPTPTAAASPTP